MNTPVTAASALTILLCRCRAAGSGYSPGISAPGAPRFPKESPLPSGFRTDDYVMPLAGAVQELRPWIVRYRGHTRVK